MKIIVDIDGTICLTRGTGYADAVPRQEIIDYINSLYDSGHIIHYWTARGTVTGIDWYDMTKRQLDLWGCKYHFLQMRKPDYDLWIDDKCIDVRHLPING